MQSNPKEKSPNEFAGKFSSLADFAAGGRADFGDDIQRGGHFLARQPFAAKGDDVLTCSLGMAGAQLHFGVDRFAHLRMWPGGNARAQHRRMMVQHGGDFLGKNLVAGDVNHGGSPSVQHDASAAVAVRQVAGQKPAVVQHFGTRARRIQVAGEHSRAAQS